jgi:predicted dithiol-disulfide oxidoreductase (DUF899 family)
MSTRARPKIVSRDEWLTARKALLVEEKELTRRRDALSARRRRLSMVRIEKEYVFEGPDGRATLRDLFEGRRQLIVQHFMFDPDPPPPGHSGAPWDEGCPGCSYGADHIGHLAHLHARDTSLVLVSRARFAKIAPFKARMGWTVPWYSSFGSDFNYDFHVTLDEAAGSDEWNYQSTAALLRAGKIPYTKGEMPGLSVFLRDGEEVFHTYSTFARGLEAPGGTHYYLDLTPFGRQEDWEDSPAGWPQTPTYGWTRHHDKYDDAPGESGGHSGETAGAPRG